MRTFVVSLGCFALLGAAACSLAPAPSRRASTAETSDADAPDVAVLADDAGAAAKDAIARIALDAADSGPSPILATWNQSWATGEIAAVVPRREGGVLIAGQHRDDLVDETNKTGHGFLLALAPDGSEVWHRVLPELHPRAVVQLPSGDWFVAGVRLVFDDEGEWYVGADLSVFSASGEARWSRKLADSPNIVYPVAATVDDAGEVVVAAQCNGSFTYDTYSADCQKNTHALLAAVGFDGAFRWGKSIAPTIDDPTSTDEHFVRPVALLATKTNHFVLSAQYSGRLVDGPVSLPKGTYTAALLELDEKGTTLRGKSFVATKNYGSSWIADLALDDAGHLAVTGGYQLGFWLDDGVTRTAPFGAPDGPDPAGFVAMLDEDWHLVWDHEWFDESYGQRVWFQAGDVVLQGVWGGPHCCYDPRLYVARLSSADGAPERSSVFARLGWGGSTSGLAPDGSLWAAGAYRNAIDFGLGPLPDSGGDFTDRTYVVKLHP